MVKMSHAIAKALVCRRGVAATEYAILTVGVAIIVGGAVVLLLDPNTSAFRVLGQTLLDTQAGLAGGR